MAIRGTDVNEPLFANSLCWHIDWAQFNWSQQTARHGVTWELKKPVPGQYTCRNILGQEEPSLNGKLQCNGLMVSDNCYIPSQAHTKTILMLGVIT